MLPEQRPEPRPLAQRLSHTGSSFKNGIDLPPGSDSNRSNVSRAASYSPGTLAPDERDVRSANRGGIGGDLEAGVLADDQLSPHELDLLTRKRYSRNVGSGEERGGLHATKDTVPLE